ncbi:MAG: phage integrase N-terminal SAM-like domain-containing protein [Verrucomicrobia bacterium]|jgi:hypothetical protein|nr:phage integrase N-terminal SAM-like domain-containing protein [Verrucomicrobiota bacterium]
MLGGIKTTPSREKFIEVSTLKGYSARAIQTYVSVVAGLARHYHRSPAALSAAEVRAYLHCVSTITGYLHLSRQTMERIHSPLDTMNWSAPPAL